MKDFLGLRKNLKKDFSPFKKLKVAILGDSATQFLNMALRGYGYDVSLNLDIWEADYDQIERQILDPGSEFNEIQFDYVVIFYSSQKLLKSFYKLNSQDQENFSHDFINNISSLYDNILSYSSSKVILYNFLEINDGIFGNFTNKIPSSFPYQIRELNFRIMELSKSMKNLFISDLKAIQNLLGEKVYDDKLYINSEMTLSLEALPYVSKSTIDIILASTGVLKKCLILDLDNTLWGGIIGDDGLENIKIGNLGIGKAYSELQLWVKELKKRGIIIAVSSKNDERIAKEPFEKHPDMHLKLDDIAVFAANWETKVDNILYIQSILNIGMDSIVFLDDNPFERSIVKTNIPDLTVPELPEDPADVVPYLRKLNLFETASFSEEDSGRTKQYQEEANRKILQKSFMKEDEFLNSLSMVAEVKPFVKFDYPRIAQLTQRSNQFNLRTIRYSEEEIERIANDNNYLTLAFNLEDKFGSYGLISVIILKKLPESLFIDTWIMSCRVLKRGMEDLILNKIVDLAVEYDFNLITGEYLPTKKNIIVADLFDKLGFNKNQSLYHLNINNYQPKVSYINLKFTEASTKTEA
jgi:FkbH-like protein